MDWAAAFGLLVSLITPDTVAAARQLWQAEGKDPDEFDAMVANSKASRAATIAQQRSEELGKLGGR